jgi:hypothetical protein
VLGVPKKLVKYVVHLSKRKKLKKNYFSLHKLPKLQFTNYWSQGILGIKTTNIYQNLIIQECYCINDIMSFQIQLIKIIQISVIAYLLKSFRIAPNVVFCIIKKCHQNPIFSIIKKLDARKIICFEAFYKFLTLKFKVASMCYYFKP